MSFRATSWFAAEILCYAAEIPVYARTREFMSNELLAKFKKLKFYAQDVVFFALKKQHDVRSQVNNMDFASGSTVSS